MFNVLLIDNVELDDPVEPGSPANLRLDGSSTLTLINITWDIPEGISPAIITYLLNYSLTRPNGSKDSAELLVSSVYCLVHCCRGNVWGDVGVCN